MSSLLDLNLPSDLSDRERSVVALSSALAAELAPTAVEYDRDGRFPALHYQRLHEAGYIRLAVPREYGGDGASLFELVLAQERLAQADAATAIGLAMMLNVIGREAESREWPAELFATVASTLARDGGLINNVVTEPDLGSISRGGVPATTAKPVPGGWSVSGHKSFVSAAPALRYLLTAVHLPPSPASPQGEVARLVIDAPAEGLRFESTWSDALSQRTGASDDAFFENVFVPEGRIVERHAVGSHPTAGVNGWWLTLVAVYLGLAQASLDAATDYARSRVPTVLGQPIGNQAHIQQWLGQMQAQVIGARSQLYELARRWTHRPEERALLGPLIAAAKHNVTNTACAVTELGLRVAGGFSLTRQLTLERHFRDARGGLFQPPQDDLALGLLGRHALARRAHTALNPTPGASA